MLPIILILIFIRPFISSLAFPYLDIVYSQTLLAFLAVYIIYKKISFLKIKNLFCPFSLFFLALCISTIFSEDKINSFSEIYKYIIGFLLFFVVASLSKEDRIMIIRSVILSGIVISLLAIYQYHFGFKHLSNYLAVKKLLIPSALDYIQRKRVFLPFVTANMLGGYLAMIALLIFFNKKKIWVLPILFALLLTKSLGALISLFLAAFILFYIQGEFKKKNIIILSGLFIFIVFIFVLRSVAPNVHVQPVFSTEMRLNYWQEVLKIIIAHPFVGIGPGNFNSALSRYAHNSYLQIWAETGILGLFSFIWIIYVVIKSYLKQLSNPLSKSRIAGLIAAIFVFLIHNFLDFTFFLPEVAYIWWVILGLGII